MERTAYKYNGAFHHDGITVAGRFMTWRTKWHRRRDSPVRLLFFWCWQCWKATLRQRTETEFIYHLRYNKHVPILSTWTILTSRFFTVLGTTFSSGRLKEYTQQHPEDNSCYKSLHSSPPSSNSQTCSIRSSLPWHSNIHSQNKPFQIEILHRHNLPN